ncbi:hypothetical protein NY08_2220 [Rhodococcus sp. B7740]|uniref:SRPBCC family protein n=1 Tax=Rhodococcus sp. B7740 TaxID=1564114 RepID=UPI0005D75700|nr:SRPBCC family protein [Rhodococcus sp. B7740]AJW40248.1 hypothetical protein NY08_2220 [Rhodococcus sp. B7740]
MTTDLRWPGKAADEEFLADGLGLIDVSVPLRASAEAVWEAFADLHGSVFFPGFREEHSAPVPGREGTVRRLSTPGGVMKFDEYYFLWDDLTRRRAFYVAGYSRRPILSTVIAEEHRVVRDGSGSVLHWRFVVEPTPFLRLLSLVVTPVLSALLRRRFSARLDAL